MAGPATPAILYVRDPADPAKIIPVPAELDGRPILSMSGSTTRVYEPAVPRTIVQQTFTATDTAQALSTILDVSAAGWELWCAEASDVGFYVGGALGQLRLVVPGYGYAVPSSTLASVYVKRAAATNVTIVCTGWVDP